MHFQITFSSFLASFALLQCTTASPFFHELIDKTESYVENKLSRNDDKPQKYAASLDLFNGFQNSTHSRIRGYAYIANNKPISLKSMTDPLGPLAVLTSDRIGDVQYTGNNIKVQTNQLGYIEADVARQAAGNVTVAYSFDKNNVQDINELPRMAAWVTTGPASYEVWNVKNEAGWFLISDIDDTVKVTGVNDRFHVVKDLLMEKAPIAVPKIAEAYLSIRNQLGELPTWFVSAAPWQNQEPTRKYLKSIYDFHFELVMKDVNKFKQIFSNPQEYKTARILPIQERFSKGNYVYIGDSTEKVNSDSCSQLLRHRLTWFH